MIEFKNVSKTYSTGTEAVHEASFKIDKGDFAFLVRTIRFRKINTYKAYIKRRRTNKWHNNNQWKRYYLLKTQKSTIFKKKHGSSVPRF